MWDDERRTGSTDRCTSSIVGRCDSNRKLLVEVSWANRGEFLGFRSPIWLRACTKFGQFNYPDMAVCSGCDSGLD